MPFFPIRWCFFQQFPFPKDCAASTGRCVNSTCQEVSKVPAHQPVLRKGLSCREEGVRDLLPPHLCCGTGESTCHSGPPNSMCTIKRLYLEDSRVPSATPSSLCSQIGTMELIFSNKAFHKLWNIEFWGM